MHDAEQGLLSVMCRSCNSSKGAARGRRKALHDSMIQQQNYTQPATPGAAETARQ